jgi:hypothetical protein
VKDSIARRVTQKLFGSVLLVFLAQFAQAQLTVNIGINYTSSTYGSDTGALPADANGAIGPHHFMEFINGTVGVYNRTNGALVHKSDLKFWSDAKVILSQDAALSDPRVIYDAASQRWFASQVDLNASATDPTLQQNDFLIAVSATDNPNGKWQGFIFPADPDGNFADFPTLGVDADAVYIAGDFFHGETNPVGSGLVSIPKADLLSTTPTVDNLTWYGVVGYNVHGQVLQPAICVDGSSHGNILSVSDIGNDSDPHSNVVAFAVLNAGTANPSLSPVSFLNVDPFVVPYNDVLGAPLLTPTQSDGTSALQANDARFCGCVRAVKGVLYAVHNTELNGKIAIQWYRIDATNRTLIESGTIVDPAMDLFFPSIAANAAGTVVICCNGCSSNTFISSYAYVGQTINGSTGFAAPVLLQSGVADYHGDDEQLADILEIPPLSRWGDYSATTVDPNDPTHFWTIQMVPTDTDIWTTQVTEIIVTGPKLSVNLVNNNPVISWPASSTGFRLQSSLDPAATNWGTITQNLTTNSGQIFYTAPVGSTPGFYRLKL